MQCKYIHVHSIYVYPQRKQKVARFMLFYCFIFKHIEFQICRPTCWILQLSELQLYLSTLHMYVYLFIYLMFPQRSARINCKRNCSFFYIVPFEQYNCCFSKSFIDLLIIRPCAWSRDNQCGLIYSLTHSSPPPPTLLTPTMLLSTRSSIVVSRTKANLINKEIA